MQPPSTPALPPLPLPTGVRSRIVERVNGLDVHVLEAGAGDARPCVLLLHGYPELAYSWRQVMPALADAGYHAVAPDQRGYGRTTGWDDRYDGDVRAFRMLNLVTDALALLDALGLEAVDAVIGHDFGSVVAGYAALIRPDVFRSVVMMSAPFAGPPALSFRAAGTLELDAALAALDPPRKHYTHYFSTAEANADMARSPQGLHNFLRAYFHVKSGDFVANAPAPLPLPLRSLTAFAALPTYYVMERGKDMAATVAPNMPSPAEIAACHWLTDDDLRVYAAEFGRTGFQGGLNWYRCMAEPAIAAELAVFSGRTIDVPAAFIAGERDWGVHQTPGAYNAMQTELCTRMTWCRLLEGAGHWVQQENPKAVSTLLLKFLAETTAFR